MKRTPARQVTRQYQTYGLMGGIAMGFLTGILVSGPHFQEWPVSRSLVVIVCFVGGGAAIGWTLLAMAVGFMGGTVASDYEDLRDDDQLDDERRHQSATGANDA